MLLIFREEMNFWLFDLFDMERSVFWGLDSFLLRRGFTVISFVFERRSSSVIFPSSSFMNEPSGRNFFDTIEIEIYFSNESSSSLSKFLFVTDGW